MGVTRNAGRAVVMTTALLGVLASVAPSQVATNAQSRATHTVASATWAVVATTAGSAPYGTGPLVLDFGTSGVRDHFFNVVNTGSVALTGTTYSVSGAGMPNGGTVTLGACVGGVWNEATDTCTGGTATAIATSDGTFTTASVSAAGLYPQTVGAGVRLLALLSKNPKPTTTVTVGVSVSRTTQVGVGKTTNG
jgi:hypothetical protein